MLQVMALSLSAMSFGGASTLTNAATNFMVNNGGGLVGKPNAANEMQGVRQTVLENLVFQEYAHRELGLDYPSTVFAEPYFEPKEGGGEWVYNFNVSPGLNLNNRVGEAGQVRVFCTEGSYSREVDRRGREVSSGTDGSLCSIRRDAMTSFINSLIPVAETIMNGTYATRGAELNSQASEIYARNISRMKRDLEGRISDNYQAYLEKTEQAINESGWMALGAFYWTVANATETASALYSNKTSASSVLWEKLDYQHDGDLKPYIDRVGLVLKMKPTSLEEKRMMANALTPDEVIELAYKGENAQYSITNEPPVLPSADEFIAASSSGSFGDAVIYQLSRPFKAVIDSMIHALVMKGHDPISSLSSVGHTMIGVGEATLALSVIVDSTANGIAEAVKTTEQGLLGKAGGLIGVTQAASALRSASTTAVGYAVLGLQAAAIPLIVAGAGLAFYLPMVPFILYTFGVVSILILTIESAVLAPIWGAALAMPDGEGMLGNAGKQGFALFMGILLRPPLLVIGFFISFLLMQGVGNVLGYIMLIATSGVLSGHIVGLVTALSMIFIVGTFMIAITHKVFGITTWLPDNAVRWFGQQIQNLGEGHDTKGVGGVVAGHINTSGNTARMAGMGNPSLGSGGGGGGKASLKADGSPADGGTDLASQKDLVQGKSQGKTTSPV